MSGARGPHGVASEAALHLQSVSAGPGEQPPAGVTPRPVHAPAAAGARAARAAAGRAAAAAAAAQGDAAATAAHVGGSCRRHRAALQ